MTDDAHGAVPHSYVARRVLEQATVSRLSRDVIK
jgi:hypothetical protein